MAIVGDEERVLDKELAWGVNTDNLAITLHCDSNKSWININISKFMTAENISCVIVSSKFRTQLIRFFFPDSINPVFVKAAAKTTTTAATTGKRIKEIANRTKVGFLRDGKLRIRAMFSFCFQ